MSFKMKLLPLALAQVIAGGAFSVMSMAPAMAQEAAPDTAPVQRIEVTGSMIKRINAESAEAITIITADSLKDKGITSVEQALQMVTANNPGVTTATNVATYNGGASLASLRGLGATKTLVLLDGQRMANNVALGAGVDLNTIPFAAIDHIEILQEGASSLYGSDAIAGVINFITKKNLDGGEVNINYARPQSAGGADGSVDFSYGHGDVDNDGYNLMITANYTHQDELTASQRPFASTGFNPAQGLSNLNGPYAPAPGSYTDANGNLFQTGYPNCGGVAHVVAVNGSCQLEYSAVVDLIPKTTSESGLISFTKKLPGNNTLNLQYFISRFVLETWGGPQSYAFNMTPGNNPTYFPTAANSTGVGNTATPDLNDPITAGWTDPANNRYNGNVNTEQRFLATLSGSNFGWDYATAIDWSRNKGVQKADGGYANYAIIAPGNLLSNVINPFGPQSAAGNALINSAYTSGDLEVGTLTLASLNGHASHSLGDAFGAGRPAQFAVGFDIRDESITDDPTALAATLYTATYFPPTTVTGTRQSEAAFMELNVPVSKQLDFTLSDRVDRYSDFGITQNSKVSFAYQPSDMLKIRGAASTGFRAPTLVEEYSPNTFGATQGTMNGPGCASGNYNAVFSQLNCISQGLSLTGGNTNLKPETSENFDLGFILEPMPNLDVTLDYYRINVKNEIQAIQAPTIYGNPTQFANLYVLNTAGTLTPAPAANIQCPTPQAATCGYIIQTDQNTGGITTDGIDLSANYLLKTNYGKFRFGMNGDLVLNYELQEYAGGPQVSLAGKWNQGNPPVIRYQQLTTLDWTMDKFGAGLNEHFTKGYRDQEPDAAGNAIEVGNYSLWNAYVSYKPMKTLRILGGINNLFNTDPPFSNQNQNWQAGYNPVFSSPLGRTFYARATYDF
jgi:iron complex outermembrane receptor protein